MHHKNKKLYNCSKCPFISDDKPIFILHLRKCKYRPTSQYIRKRSYKCDFCNAVFKSHAQLEYHEAFYHRCLLCSFRGNLSEHTNCIINYVQVGGASRDIGPFHTTTDLHDTLNIYQHRSVPFHFLTEYLESVHKYIDNILHNSIDTLRSIKALVHVYVTFKRKIDEVEFEKKDYILNSNVHIILNHEDVSDFIPNIEETIQNNIYIFQEYGSGWFLDSIQGIDLKIGVFRSIRVGCFCNVPYQLYKKQAVVNVKCYDNSCFKWSILAALHPAKTNSNAVSSYRQYENKYDFTCVTFPIKLPMIKIFEEKNSVCVNLFSWEENEYGQGYIIPERISKHNYTRIPVANLLLLHKDGVHHIVTISNISKIIGKKNSHKKELCYNCLNTFTQTMFKDHVVDCLNFAYQKIFMPKKKNGEIPQIKFKEYNYQLKIGYVVYSDFECVLKPIDKPMFTKPKVELNEENVTSFTNYMHHHRPSGFSYVLVDSESKVVEFDKYNGENCVEIFIKTMRKIRDKVFERYDDHKAMIITDEQEDYFQNTDICHICNKLIDIENNEVKVRDHSHETGLFRGVAHATCNSKYRQRYKLPLILHNLSNYDAFLILEGFKVGKKFSVVPKTNQRFLSIEVDGLIMLDSCAFLLDKLEVLVEHLKKEGDDAFSILNQIFKEKAPLLSKKGIFPYEWMNSFDKFKEKQLPYDIKDYYSSLNDTYASEDDIKYAQQIFKLFDCKNVEDYQSVYLLSDSALLACVFEKFRSTSLFYYKLDPCYFLSAAGLSWSAALKMTNVELELITDVSMFEMMELGLRGGVTFINQRQSTADNIYTSPEKNFTNQKQTYLFLTDVSVD